MVKSSHCWGQTALQNVTVTICTTIIFAFPVSNQRPPPALLILRKIFVKDSSHWKAAHLDTWTHLFTDSSMFYLARSEEKHWRSYLRFLHCPSPRLSQVKEPVLTERKLPSLGGRSYRFVYITREIVYLSLVVLIFSEIPKSQHDIVLRKFEQNSQLFAVS